MNDADHIEERQAATALVKLVKGGDRGAEAEMVERYSRGLRATAAACATCCAAKPGMSSLPRTSCRRPGPLRW
jgi:hypothetical protein